MADVSTTDNKTTGRIHAGRVPVERTSPELERLKELRAKLRATMGSPDDMDQVVDFDTLKRLVDEIQGTKGSWTDWLAQGTRGLLKGAMIPGEGLYGLIKLAADVGQRAGPLGPVLNGLDGAILAENVRLGNVTAGSTASAIGSGALGIVLPADAQAAFGVGNYLEGSVITGANAVTLGAGSGKVAGLVKGERAIAREAGAIKGAGAKAGGKVGAAEGTTVEKAAGGTGAAAEDAAVVAAAEPAVGMAVSRRLVYDADDPALRASGSRRWRGDTRSLDDLKESNGFQGRDPKARIELGDYKVKQPHEHQWVSTSTDPTVASNPMFTRIEGNLFLIEKPGGMDVGRALGMVNDVEAEIIFSGRGISLSEIVGSYPVRSGNVVGPFVPNPFYTGPPVTIPKLP